MKRYFKLIAGSCLMGLVCYILISNLPEETYQLFKIRKDNLHEMIYLVDLDNDGFKEQIEKRNLVNTATLFFKAGNNTLEYQHNFLSNWTEISQFFFGDYNQNNLLEVYGFQFENDSLFISAVEYPQKVVLNRQFVVSGFSDLTSSNLNGGIFFTKDGDSLHGKVALSVMGGYGAKPRNLFLLDIDTGNSISTSDSIKSYLHYFDSFDVDQDGTNELIAWGRAPNNNSGNEFFSDQDSYVMVFDHQLNLVDWHKNPGIGSTNFFWKQKGAGFIVMNSIDSLTRSKVYTYSRRGLLELNHKPDYDFHIGYPPLVRDNEAYFGIISNGIFKSFHKLNAGISSSEFIKYPDELTPLLAHNFQFLSTDHFFSLDLSDSKIYTAKSLEDAKTALGELSTEYPLSITEGNFRDKRIIVVSTKGHTRFWEIKDSFWYTHNLMLSAFVVIFSFALGLFISIPRKRELTDERLDQILRINTRNGFEIIPFEQILYCKADGKYTIVETVDNGSVLSSTNLGAIEPKIVSSDFIRLGRSIIINKKYLRKVDRKKLKAYFKVNTGIKELDLTAQEVKGLSGVFE